MANALKGEVSLPLVGGEEMTMVYTINSLILLESTFGLKVENLTEAFEAGNLVQIRGVFWAGLQKHQPDITQERAGEIMGECGGLEAASAFMLKALMLSFPTAAPKAEGAVTADPQPGPAAKAGEAGKPS